MTGEVSPWDDREQVSHHYLNVKANSRCLIVRLFPNELLFGAEKNICNVMVKTWANLFL